MLERTFESAFKATIGEIHSKCEMISLCPIYFKSVVDLESTLNIIGNVSASTGILLLHGQNDTSPACLYIATKANLSKSS